MDFVEREREIEALENCHASDRSEFVAVYGIRKVGKIDGGSTPATSSPWMLVCSCRTVGWVDTVSISEKLRIVIYEVLGEVAFVLWCKYCPCTVNDWY